ncbi:2TM domain-containing protein [Leptospira interrogans]
MTIDSNTPTEPTGEDTKTQSPDREKFKRAMRRVDEIKGFYTHLATFFAVIAGLVVVNLVTGGDWWVQWVFLGWGIGVLVHALITFGGTPKFVSQWEKRKLREYMNER